MWVDYICKFLYVVVYVNVNVCVYVYDNTCTWQICGCHMNISVLIVAKRTQSRETVDALAK